ncbi:hypothetical protein SMATCC274_08920 [Serratia marcescens]|nr:hypothetical protein SMATCC274_08920 [Serratia marcescens]
MSDSVVAKRPTRLPACPIVAAPNKHPKRSRSGVYVPIRKWPLMKMGKILGVIKMEV